MKLGILTFHSQLNYGGVLQAFALQTALERMGHEVVIVDRWLNPKNESLRGPFVLGAWKAWFWLLACGVQGCGSFGRAVRHCRTIGFVRKFLRLTPYHFHQWQEMAGKALGVDCLVVGSDQVWHGGDWGNPRPYLLEGAPEISAIAYAASLGMRKIPEGMLKEYREGFKRFSAISVREAEAVGLVESAGAQATHVVDPTQLLSATEWRNSFHLQPVVKSYKRRLVCYFLSEDVQAALPKLEAFSREMVCEVEVFVDWFRLRSVRSLQMAAKRMVWLFERWRSPVRLRLSAGPREFVEAFANATWVLSDSFHALMFSSIFEKNVRILCPRDAFRQKMFARIEEFATQMMEGDVVAEDVQEALRAFAVGRSCHYRSDKLAERQAGSRLWLEKALGGLGEKINNAPPPQRDI